MKQPKFETCTQHLHLEVMGCAVQAPEQSAQEWTALVLRRRADRLAESERRIKTGSSNVVEEYFSWLDSAKKVSQSVHVSCREYQGYLQV